MLAQIPLLSFLILGVTYVLFFFLDIKEPIKNSFHRFHLGFPVIMAGLAILGLWMLDISLMVKYLAIFWLLMALLGTMLMWKLETVRLSLMFLLGSTGLILFGFVFYELVAPDPLALIVTILGGFVLTASMYAMNLGHFYLNVQGLSIHHFKKAVIIFGVVLVARLLWNLFYFITGKVFYQGDFVSLLYYIQTLDGLFLGVGALFGIIFPLGTLYFVWETLRLKNTQSATGILYVILAGILIGHVVYMYYLLKYGIPL